MSASSAIPFYTGEDVRRLLDYDGCIATLRDAMAAFSAGEDTQPLRSIIALEPAKLFALMPGVLPGGGPFGAKVVSAFGEPDRPGRTAHRGIVVLFEPDRGEVVAIADAGEITHIRTAAASAVATDALARADARTLVIFGYGAQAASHAHALTRVRPFDRLLVWGRDAAAGEAFVSRIRGEIGVPSSFVADAEAAAAAADVLCTTTGSPTPLLRGAWLRPGIHVNLVGSSHAGAAEADHAVVARGRFFVDSRRAALAAAGEYLNARAAGLVADDHIAGEIGEVLLGRVPGRRNEDEITVYKSLGHIVQDLAAITYVRDRAVRDQAAA